MPLLVFTLNFTPKIYLSVAVLNAVSLNSFSHFLSARSEDYLREFENVRLRVPRKQNSKHPREPWLEIHKSQGGFILAEIETISVIRTHKFRRILVRYDYHAENFLGFVHLACIRILLRCYLCDCF